MYLIALAIVVLAMVTVGIPFFLKWLAEENILFTTVKEGTVKVIMRGGSLDRFLMSFSGYHLNDPSNKSRYKEDQPEWEVLYHGKGNPHGFTKEEDDYYDDRPALLKNLGLYWVGWPWANSIYVYAFEWNETYTKRESGEEKVLPRSEATDFVYVADFTYAIVTEDAETKDRLPTDELTLVTLAVRNPYRALFSGEDWMRRVTAAINRHVRTFIGEKDFQDLISTKNLTEFSAPVIALTGKLPDDGEDDPPHGLQGRYGVAIRTADLQTIELSGAAKEEHQAAATRAYVAEQEAKATLLAGEAAAKVVEMMGEKEASALRARLEVIKEHGEAGMTLAQLDAMQESSKGAGNTIIWANSPFVPLAEALNLKGKGGGK